MLRYSATIRSSLLASATDDEIHVAQILLHISSMIPTPQSGPALRWGGKRKRSGAPAKAEMEAAAAASPVTPLAFPRTQFDDNKTSKKRSREEYFDMIEELSQRRDLLRGEIESVTNYYNKLIAHNSQLKAMKHEALNSWPRKGEPKWGSSRDGNLAVELTSKNHEMSETHRQPLVEDQTAEIIPCGFNGPISAQLCDGLRPISRVGPTAIPDLNVSAEEINQPLDWSGDIKRARFAEARRRRMDIIRVKSMRSAPCVFKRHFPRIR